MNIKKYLPLCFLLAAFSLFGAEIYYKNAPHFDKEKGSVVMCCKLVPLPKTEQQELLRIINLFKAKKTNEALRINDKLIVKIEKLLAKDSRRAIASPPSESMVLINLMHSNKRSTYLVSRDWMLPYYLRAFAYFEKKKPQLAKEALEKALKLSPYDPQVLNERGHYYSIRKQWEKAEKDFSTALEMAKLIRSNEADSKSFQGRALRGLGYVAVERKQWQKAEDYYTQALKLNPQDHKAKGELIYVQTNRQQK